MFLCLFLAILLLCLGDSSRDRVNNSGQQERKEELGHRQRHNVAATLCVCVCVCVTTLVPLLLHEVHALEVTVLIKALWWQQRSGSNPPPIMCHPIVDKRCNTWQNNKQPTLQHSNPTWTVRTRRRSSTSVTVSTNTVFPVRMEVAMTKMTLSAISRSLLYGVGA